MGFDRSERGNGGVSVRFVLLARGTVFDILSHKLHEARPPEFSSDELAGFEISGVAGGLMIMAAGKDGTTEGILWWDVDATLVSQDVVVKFPVRETRPEGSGDVLQGCL